MRKIGMCLCVAIGLAASPASQTVRTQNSDAKRLLGGWRLASVTQGGDVRLDPTRGPKPTGVIYYDATGNMAAQIMPDPAIRRAYAGAQPTSDEAKAALVGYTAYFGTYTVDERARTVTHHRKGNIHPGVLSDLVRRYEFLSNDRVVLLPTESQNRLVWERIK